MYMSTNTTQVVKQLDMYASLHTAGQSINIIRGTITGEVEGGAC